ncbi:hypothetical protein QQ73_03995 [Candidatus Endoriftia persephone str. Guaymas]|nr:hypothetical protein [Candidatus Endoriftia persephone str. Guaymas]
MNHLRRPQQGAAFLLLIFSLTMALAMAVVGKFSIDRFRLHRANTNLEQLQQAKQALIGYAVMHSRPGALPCPDYNGDGRITNPEDHNGSRCRSESGGTMRPGWLPWRELGVAQLIDSSNATLWYLPSPAYTELASVPLNSDTSGALRLDGQEDIVALVIAPGPVLDQQQRSSAVMGNADRARSAHLEGENRDSDADFTQARPASTGLNDRLIAITRRELMQEVERRVAAEIALRLRDYVAGCSRFPDAVPFTDPSGLALFDSQPGTSEGLLPIDSVLPANWGSGCAAGASLPPWFQANNWHWLSYFASAATNCSPGVDCLEVANLPGRRDNKQGLLLLAGIDLSGRRPSATLSDYFEGENGQSGNRRFDLRPPGGNDTLRVILP